MNIQTRTVPKRLSRLGKSCLLAAGVAAALNTLPLALNSLAPGLLATTVQAAEEERRPPPEARQSETLGRAVYERIE